MNTASLDEEDISDGINLLRTGLTSRADTAGEGSTLSAENICLILCRLRWYHFFDRAVQLSFTGSSGSSNSLSYILGSEEIEEFITNKGEKGLMVIGNRLLKETLKGLFRRTFLERVYE